MVLLLREGACDIPIRCFFKEALDLGADYVAIGHYGGCDFRNRILGNATDTSGCCGELAQPAAVSNYMSRSLFIVSFIVWGG